MKRIKIENISKKFKIGFKKREVFLERLLHFFSGKEPKKTIYALKDVSLSVNSGEILGIIGRNGSGKSTLLRIIAGIYKEDKGRLNTNGNIISLIGLGTGLKIRLMMKENIFLVGSLFGLSREMIQERFNQIVEFAELEDFVNTKLYQFSQGMIQRLAFSIAIHCDPEILLLDEVFEVGDEKFRRKSAKRIKELAKTGVSVVFVSHEIDMIKRNCNKLVWMKDGEIFKEGNVEEILKTYSKDNKI